MEILEDVRARVEFGSAAFMKVFRNVTWQERE
jgi:hypothetical protein